MSDSPLVNVRIISPNRHHTRNHKIDTITIHHMAGNLSVEQCGKIFQNTKREASSNYGIGSDGRIGLYVHEEDRAWTSGSPSNDHRAITIEVANDGLADTGWHVSDKALAALVDLLEDVCRRNGIKRLVWSEDKYTRIHHEGGANMTVHRDFQATLCPGPYLYSKHGWIAEEVNKRLQGEEGMTYEQWCAYMDRYRKELAQKPPSQWAQDARIMERAKAEEIVTGGRPKDFATREELAAVGLTVAHIDD